MVFDFMWDLNPSICRSSSIEMKDMTFIFEQSSNARRDIFPIFEKLKSPKCDGIEKWVFLEFLENVQECDMKVEATRKIWNIKADMLVANSTCCMLLGRNNQHIDFPRFVFYITSDCNVYEQNDLSRTKLLRPLNEYFISCSHNTYLIGRQFDGEASVEGYVNALGHGCRSVEIDCWDGKDGNPIVKHGFNIAPSIPFIDVIHCINTHAFKASPYPVIISLETHCCAEQQARMVNIMKRIFAHRLLFQPLSSIVGDLPSPEALKYKILVKVKSMQAQLGKTAHFTTLISKATRTATAVCYGILSGSASHSSWHCKEPRAESEKKSKTKITSSFDSNLGPRCRVSGKITPELASLAVYFQSFNSRDVQSLAALPSNHIFSVDEMSAMSQFREPRKQRLFQHHNVHYMCRVYPKALRINSSNFNPNLYWRHGVQMVAMNYQTYDMNMQINEAMFAAGSDRSGYVLKPDYLRKLRISASAHDSVNLNCQEMKVSVTIISVRQASTINTVGNSDKINSIVRVRASTPEDDINSRSTTKTTATVDAFARSGSHYVQGMRSMHHSGQDGRSPSMISLSVKTSHPELMFLHFDLYRSSIWLEKSAVFTAKLNRICGGYRHIPLYDKNGCHQHSFTIFCHIRKHSPISIHSAFI